MRLLLFALFLITACGDPVIGIPGGQLKGKVFPVPDHWGAVPDVIQLEVRPADPYSLNIWGLVDNENLYVATLNARWVPYIAADRQVRVRINE